MRAGDCSRVTAGQNRAHLGLSPGPSFSLQGYTHQFVRPSVGDGASQVALMVKNPPANAGDLRDEGLTPGSARSPGEGHGNPLQYSCLENPMDRGAWRAKSIGWQRVAKSQT